MHGWSKLDIDVLFKYINFASGVSMCLSVERFDAVGLGWVGLGWIGFDSIRLDWTGLDWTRLHCIASPPPLSASDGMAGFVREEQAGGPHLSPHGRHGQQLLRGRAGAVSGGGGRMDWCDVM